MGLKVTLSNPTAQKVAFSQTDKPLTLRTTTAATSLDKLSDVDLTEDDAQEDGSTLMYDVETQSFKSKSIFKEVSDNQYQLDGGDF